MLSAVRFLFNRRIRQQAEILADELIARYGPLAEAHLRRKLRDRRIRRGRMAARLALRHLRARRSHRRRDSASTLLLRRRAIRDVRR